MSEVRMTMTQKLAMDLMDTLACLAISAMGYDEHIIGYSEDGFPLFTDEFIGRTREYSRNKFIELCGEWEEQMNQKWKIETEDSELN